MRFLMLGKMEIKFQVIVISMRISQMVKRLLQLVMEWEMAN